MAAIFDMDGLLLNTDPVIWVESMHEIAHKHKIDISIELLQHTKGLRIYEVTSFWADYFNWEDKAKSVLIADEILDAVVSNTKEKGKVLPGVVPLLQQFKSANIPIGLATSSPEKIVNVLLDFFELSQYFDVICTADNCLIGKPHPEVYLNCAQLLNVKPWLCVAFEDSINGMIAAKAARMQVVAVPDKEQFSNAKFELADKKVSTLLDFHITDYHNLITI